MDALSTQQIKVLDTASSTSSTVESSLPKGEQVKATIRQVSPDQANSNSHKIKLQINNSLIEISAKLAGPPPPAGSSVTLQRSESGQIQIQFNSTTAQTPTAPPTASTLSAAKPAVTNPFVQSNNGNTILNAPVVINASGKELSIIEKILPKGESVFARVINQPTTNAQVKPNLNVPSSFAISNSQTPAVAERSQPSQQNIQRVVSATLQQSTISSTQTISPPQQAPISHSGATPLVTPVTTASVPSVAPPTATAVNQSGQVPNAQSTPSPSITSSSTPVNTPLAQTQSAAPTLSGQATNLLNNAATNTHLGANNNNAISNPANNAVNSPSANSQPVNPSNTAPLTPLPTSTPAATSSDGARIQAPSSTALSSTAPSPNAPSPTAPSVPPASTGEKQLTPAPSSPTTSQPLPQTTAPVSQSPSTPVSLPTQPPANQVSAQEVTAKVSTQTLAPQTTADASAKIANQTINKQASPVGLVQNNGANTQTIAPAPVNPTTTAPVNQNAQLQGLQQQTSTLKVSVSGQFISLQAPANLPPLQNIQITRAEGTQANLQWQQTSFQPPTATASGLQLTSREVQVLEQSLRQVLPQQIPTAEGINQLVQQSAQIANATSAAKAPVDKVVLSILQLFGVKPGAQNSSDTIKRNVQQGGLFTENKVANQNLQQAGMKGFLAKLNFLAEQLPTEQKERLRNTTERMLARITANQITHVQQQHVKADVSNERTFQLDLPVQQNEKLDNVEMEIKQRKHTTEDGDFISIWSVKLHFDLEERGEVDAEVALNPVDNSISTTFLCSKMSTVHEIEQKMQNFRSQLNQQGFEIQTLHCSQGSQAAQANNPISKRIIDIRT